MPTTSKPKLYTFEAHPHFTRVRCIICNASFSINKGELNTLKAMDQMLGHALEHVLKKGIECRITSLPEFKTALQALCESGKAETPSTSSSATSTTDRSSTLSQPITSTREQSPPESPASSTESPRFDV